MALRLRLFAALLGLLLGQLGLGRSLEWASYDVRQRLVRHWQDRPLVDQLVLVGLDEDSARAGLGKAELEEFRGFLESAGARVVMPDALDEALLEPDGVVRRFQLLRQGRPTSLMSELARVKGTPVDRLVLPLDRQGRFYPLFHFAETEAMVSGPTGVFRLAPIPLLAAAQNPEHLKGKVVVLGSYLQSAEQVDRKTPTGSMARLELLGSLWDSLLSGHGWKPLPLAFQLALGAAWLAGLCGLLSRLQPAGAGLVWLLSLGLWALLQLELARWGLVGAVVPVWLGSLGALVTGLMLQGPLAARLVQAFSTPEPESKDGEMREASILFTMLPQFLLDLEKSDHHRASRLRREYSQLLGEVLLPHQGLILDQQGDAQMVGFGTLHPRQAHALRAVAAGLDLCRRVPELMQSWEAPPEAIHCGVCTGPVAWGEVGASGLKAAAAIGDTTNTAARLMGAARKLGKGVLISERTREQAGIRVEAEALEPLVLKGKAEPVPVFEARQALVRRQPRRTSDGRPRSWGRGAPRATLAVATLATGAAWLLGPIPWLSGWLWDRPLLHSRAPIATRVVLAGIDEACLEVHRWPWPRNLHARVLANLERAGVGCVFYDILFDTASNSTDEDRALAEAVQKFPRVVLAGAARRRAGSSEVEPPSLLPGLDVAQLRERMQVGLIHSRMEDQEGRLRSLALVYRELNPAYPAAALAVAAQLQRQPLHPGPPLQLGSQRLPEQCLVRWQRPRRLRYSYARLLEEPLPPLQGAVVMVGDAMPGESDRFDTPVGPMKGAEVHAQLLETLLAPRPPQDLRESRWGTLLAGLACALVAGLGMKARRFAELTLVSLAGLGLAWLGHFWLTRAGWVLSQEPVTSVALAGLLLLLGRTLMSVSALRRFVPDSIVLDLVQRGETPDRVGEATILVTDIRGYTSLSERRSPVQILELLNEYHEETVACYERHGGSVLTYQGDAQLVVFGLLRPLARPALAAVRAAMELEQVVSRLRSRWNLSEHESFDVGAGLCSGLLTVGILRAGDQQQFTVIGDSVRRAHKVQSQSDLLGRSVLLDERTRVLCGEELNFDEVGELFSPRN